MTKKNEWPARKVTLEFYHPQMFDNRFSGLDLQALKEAHATEIDGWHSAADSLSDGKSWTASNGVTITAIADGSSSLPVDEMRAVRGGRITVISSEEAYQAGLEAGRREAYFDPQIFDDLDYEYEMATLFGMTAEDVAKRIRNQSDMWKHQRDRRMNLPHAYPEKKGEK